MLNKLTDLGELVQVTPDLQRYLNKLADYQYYMLAINYRLPPEVPFLVEEIMTTVPTATAATTTNRIHQFWKRNGVLDAASFTVSVPVCPLTSME
jgi:hypothetical protein